MPAFGFSPFGLHSFGSISGPATGYSLGPFQFEVRALNEGRGIKIRFYAPSVADAPLWNRWLRVMRKQGEWPQSWDDAGAYVSVVGHFPTEGWYEYTELELEPGLIYYYGLFELRNDGVWIHDEVDGRRWAYPYDQWGFQDYLFSIQPRGFKTDDADLPDHPLQNFLRIFGALLDASKTDVEHLATLIDIYAIHQDLLPLLDAKIGWPTYYAAGGIQRRNETAVAVDLFKILGTEAGYEALLSEVAQWNCEVYEGWRYVMFSNGLYDSTTPDTTDPDLLLYQGTVLDKLKYTNHKDHWHSVSGLLFVLTEIPGVSGALTQVMINRLLELVEWSKATYVNYGLVVGPVSEEIVETPEDDYVDAWYYIDIEGVSVEELGWTTSDLEMFMSNDPLSVTCSLVDRTYHSAIEYL